jgi:hypothetical protein
MFTTATVVVVVIVIVIIIITPSSSSSNAFQVTKRDKIMSGDQPRQLKIVVPRFRYLLCLHHQGMTASPETLPLHLITALSLFLHFIIHCYTHTSRVLVTHLKHRNSPTELHTPNITHKVFSSQPHSCN